MVGTRDNKSGVLAVTAATTATLAFFLIGCGPGIPEPESAPLPSDAPVAEGPTKGDGAIEDRSVPAVSTAPGEDAGAASVTDRPETSLVADPDSEVATKPSAGDRVDSDSEFATKPSAGDRVDSDPEFAVEIVEELAPTELAGGARQEEPLEPIESEESDGTGDAGRETSAQGETYTWHDGDRVLEAVLQPDLTVINENAAAPGQDVVADTGQGRIVTRGADDAPGVQGASGAQGAEGAGGTSSGQPVFLSESGELMTLPGGVILVLDEDWNSDATDGFFARNGISLDRVSELDYLTNGFVIDTEPGFPSLELANALATQNGVELSSPNWSRERTTR